MTARVLAAIENPHVDCIGHLTGRLLGRREPYGIDVEAVAEAAARTGTMLEINGNPNRRDLSEHHARLASEAGVTIVLNTDAHGVETLGQHGLRGGDGAPGLAHRGQSRQHPRLAGLQEAAEGVGAAGPVTDLVPPPRCGGGCAASSGVVPQIDATRRD